MAEVIGNIEPGELDVKRLYAPGLTIKDNCPNCGKEVIVDLGRQSLSYPVINKPTEIGLYCGDGCEHEWAVPILITLKLEIQK